jgi:hypoxanthine phosphoribosyltransferase
MGKIVLHDKSFEPYIKHNEILQAIKGLANRINSDYHGQPLVVVGVLNGAFRFVADLTGSLDVSCEVSFVKMASYEGTESSGEVKTLIGFNESYKNKHVLIVEDIVDTGNTLVRIMAEMEKLNAASVKIATLLYKPEAYSKNIPIDYVGIEIPNDFIVGYGLDYDGLGRNLNDIYKISKD